MVVVPSTVYNDNKMPKGGLIFWREEGRALWAWDEGGGA